MSSAAAPVAVVGALHVDELLWPLGPLRARASNPVRRARRVGGVAANVARALRRHGGREVVLVAALGDDAEGRWLAGRIAAAGIDCRAWSATAWPTGRYTVVHDEHGELFVGLAETAVAEALAAEAVRTRLAGLAPAALALDANLDPRCLAALLARKSAADAPRVALAVSPAKATRLAPHLGAIDLLFCNRREGAALGGVGADAAIGTLGDALVAAGCRRFVLSDGAAPLLVATPATRERVEVPPLAPARSVNGAGDALAGATLARWLDGAALADAVREVGLAAAARVLRGGADDDLQDAPAADADALQGH